MEHRSPKNGQFAGQHRVFFIGRVWLAADHPKVVVDLVPSTYKPISAGVPAKEIGNWTQGVLPADGWRRFAGGRRMILLEVRTESLKKDLETQRALCADAPYTLTGPQKLTLAHAAERLGQVLAKPVNYIAIPHDTARNTMLGSGMPRWLVGASVEYAEAYSQGWGDFVTTHFQAITGESHGRS